MNKLELHAHTSECDLVADLGGAELVRSYHAKGYSGMVITDHYFSLFYEWFRDELAGAAHKEIVKRYLRGYYAAREEGERLGFTVLCGAEVRFDHTVNDYLVYGLEEQDFYELPLLNTLHSVDELLATLPDRAVVVQAHPFRNGMTVNTPSNLFGLEVYNGRTDDFRNQMAREFAAHYKRAMTSGSDTHHAKDIARGGIETAHGICCAQDLVSVLRAGEYHLITTEEKA